MTTATTTPALSAGAMPTNQLSLLLAFSAVPVLPATSTPLICAAVPVPVIASGGAGNPHDMYLGVAEGQVDAVLAASIFHFGEYSVEDVKGYLRERGVPVRQS